MVGLTSGEEYRLQRRKKKGKERRGCSLENKKGGNFEGLFKEAQETQSDSKKGGQKETGKLWNYGNLLNETNGLLEDEGRA